MSLKQLFARVRAQPSLRLLEDQTGRGLSMDYLIQGLANNSDKPLPGDAIAIFHSCGMGMTIRKDERVRVLRNHEKWSSGFWVQGEGPPDVLHVYNLRRSNIHPRFWIYMD